MLVKIKIGKNNKNILGVIKYSFKDNIWSQGQVA